MCKMRVLILLATAVAYASANCQLWANTEPLETNFPPYVVDSQTGFFVPDKFTLTLAVSRKYSQVDIHFENAGTTTASLRPTNGQTLWTANEDDCWTYNKLHLDWTDFNSANYAALERHDFDAEVHFTGTAVIIMTETVHMEEQGLVFYHNRVVSEKLVFVVQFPKFVSLGADITTFSSPVDLAAVIRQQTGNLGVQPPYGEIVVDIRTLLQSPYRYSTGYLEVVSDDASLQNGLLKELLTDCPNHDAPCEQVWRIKVYPNGCSVVGKRFTLKLRLECQPLLQDTCPLTAGDNDRDSIQFEITTGNFCPQTVDIVSLFGSLHVFEDNSHTVLKESFLTGQRAHFIARAESMEVSIAHTEVTEITTFNPFYNMYLPLNLPPFPHPDAAVEIVPTASTPNHEAWFSFIIDSGMFPTSAATATPNAFRVHARLRCEFVGNNLLEFGGSAAVKQLSDDNTRELEVSEEIGFFLADNDESGTGEEAHADSSSDSSSTSDSMLTPTFVSLLGILLFCIGGATGFVICKVATKSPPLSMDPRKSSGIDVESIRNAHR